MASRELNLILQLQDRASRELKSTFGDWEDISKRVGRSFAVMGGVITGAVGLSVRAFQQQERAEARLEQISRQVTNATDEEIQSFKNLASELQRVGVVGDEVIIAGQSQIASFTKNSKVVTTLTKDIADLAVAQYGTNVSQEQAIQTANLLGKALQGQLGALTRTGILVSDDFAKAFEEANDEQERAVILSQIIQDNYGGLNEAMRKTSAGGLQALKNDFGDLQEIIGKAVIPALQSLVKNVLPIIQRVQEWASENPKLFNTIVTVVAVTGALMLALAPLLIALPSIIAFVKMFGVVLVALTSPVGIVIGLIAGIVASLLYLRSNWDDVVWGFEQGVEFIQGLWISFVSFFSGITSRFIALAHSVISPVQTAFYTLWGGVRNITNTAWEGIKSTVKSSVNFIISAINSVIRAANNVAQSVPGVGRFLPSIPEIPMLAKGGIVTRPTLAMVGEAGPEAVIPLNKMESMGTGNITVIVNGDVSGQDLIDKVSQGIMDNLRINQRIAL